VAGNVVEEQRARVLTAVVELTGGADLKRRARPGDMLELARLLGSRDPGAKIEDRQGTATLLWVSYLLSSKCRQSAL
jgi:hypothetical protein